MSLDFGFDFEEDKKDNFKVHISIQQRTSKKYITIIKGIPEKYDLPKIVKYIKKIYKCGGSIVKDEKDDTLVIQVSGDQRQNIRKFFIDCDVMDADNIISHGF